MHKKSQSETGSLSQKSQSETGNKRLREPHKPGVPREQVQRSRRENKEPFFYSHPVLKQLAISWLILVDSSRLQQPTLFRRYFSTFEFPLIGLFSISKILIISKPCMPTVISSLRGFSRRKFARPSSNIRTSQLLSHICANTRSAMAACISCICCSLTPACCPSFCSACRKRPLSSCKLKRN